MTLYLHWRETSRGMDKWERVTHVGIHGLCIVIKMDDGWFFVIPLAEIHSWKHE